MRAEGKIIVLMVWVYLAVTSGICAASVSEYNVVWDSPSVDCHGSMPIGNGDIGANVWVEAGGDLCFYLSKTDAWDEHARLVKLGKLRVRLTPNPFAKGAHFKQELDLEDGAIKITAVARNPDAGVDLRFWIDANHPVVRITGSTTLKTVVEVMIEPWRTERTPASWDWSFSGLADRSVKRDALHYPVFIEPDTIEAVKTRSILWYHRNISNEHSVWADTLKTQGLEAFKNQSSDPLINLTFGALLQGTGLISQSPTLLRSTAPTTALDISVFPLTKQTITARDWIKQAEALATKDLKITRESAWVAHKNWWNEFWNRSWIRIQGAPGEDAFTVSQGYAL